MYLVENTLCISVLDMSVGKNIQKIRKLRGLSQPELSELCGWEYKQSRVSHYETGRRSPDAEALVELANALNCTVGALFGEDKTPPKSSSSEATAAASLTPSRQKLIAQLIVELQDQK